MEDVVPENKKIPSDGDVKNIMNSHQQPQQILV